MKSIEQDESSKFFENKIVSDYVSTRVAAQFLGISENALRIKVCRGQVPCHKFARNLRFKISEISRLFLRKE